MKRFLGNSRGHTDRDWTFPIYYLTNTGTGLICETWGKTEDADPQAVLKDAEAAWDRFEARLEQAGPLRYGINDALIREIKKEMAAIEHFILVLSEHMGGYKGTGREAGTYA